MSRRSSNDGTDVVAPNRDEPGAEEGVADDEGAAVDEVAPNGNTPADAGAATNGDTPKVKPPVDGAPNDGAAVAEEGVPWPADEDAANGDTSADEGAAEDEGAPNANVKPTVDDADCDDGAALAGSGTGANHPVPPA